jgi:hypothetical protein
MPSESTLQLYKYQLARHSNLDFANPREVVRVLTATKRKDGKENLSLSYIKGIISAIIWKLRQENKDDPLLEDYRNILSNIRGRAERDERNHNKIVGHLPDWKKIVSVRDQLKKNGLMKEHLILSLYTYISPRRILDYIVMCVVEYPEQAKDLTKNYYVTSERQFIFNVYKTAKTYKQKIVEAPEALHKIIVNYIKTHGINNGDLLLNFRNYHQINYMLKKLIGCGIDNLRHSYINNFYEGYKMPDSGVIEKLASDMGHSVTTNLRYRKY